MEVFTDNDLSAKMKMRRFLPALFKKVVKLRKKRGK